LRAEVAKARKTGEEDLSTVYAIKQIVPRKVLVTAIPAGVAKALGIRPADVLMWRVVGARAIVTVTRPEQVPVGHQRAAAAEEAARSSVYIASRREERHYLKTRVPAAVARQLDIRPGSVLAWHVEEGKIVLRVAKRGRKNDARTAVEELVPPQAT
jgi:antitoxin component of MazEF toxin-antitoxin module